MGVHIVYYGNISDRIDDPQTQQSYQIMQYININRSNKFTMLVKDHPATQHLHADPPAEYRLLLYRK